MSEFLEDYVMKSFYFFYKHTLGYENCTEEEIEKEMDKDLITLYNDYANTILYKKIGLKYRKRAIYKDY